MQAVVEPDRNATDALLLGAGHFPQSLLEIALRVFAELVGSEEVALGLDQIVRPADDEEGPVLQRAETRVERGVTAAGVQDPAVSLLLLNRRRVGVVHAMPEIRRHLGRSV